MATGRRQQNGQNNQKNNHFQELPSSSKQNHSTSSSSSGSTSGSNDDSSTKLIINYLPQSMKQEELESLFSRIGPIEKCCIIKDRKTGDSLEYGFVHYKLPEHAEKARTTLNGLKLQNKTIRVSYARPRSDSIKGANLYVSGLPKNITNEEFEAIFSPYGSIITYRVLRDHVSAKQYTETSKANEKVLSKGVAFVRFDLRQEAKLAIEKVNDTIPKGCCDPIKVKYAKNPTRYPWSLPTFTFKSNNQGCLLFVYNLPPLIQEHILWQLFGPYGAVQKVSLNRGFAFVTMTNRHEALIAADKLRGTILENRPMQIKF